MDESISDQVSSELDHIEDEILSPKTSDEALEAAAGTREWDLVSETPSSNLPCC